MPSTSKPVLPTRRRLLSAGGACALGGCGDWVSALSLGPPPAAFGETTPFLRGVNFSGKEFTPGDQWPIEPAYRYYLSQKRMNLIRLPLKWELLQPELGGPLDAEMVLGIEQQVRRVTRAGAYIILVVCNFGRRDIDGQSHIVGESREATSAHLAQLWSKLALRWGNRAGVIFGLMNEPHQQDDATLVGTLNDSMRAIRAEGARNLILVNGNDWGMIGWRPGAPNYQFVGPQAHDPLNNMAFDVHFYFDDTSGKHPWCSTESWQVYANEFTNWARANGKRALCGEFAGGPNRTCGTEVGGFLRFIEENKDVWMGWCWWCGGGWQRYEYFFRLDPYASQYFMDNPDRIAAANWDSPIIDRPQMALLQPYLPAEATPFNGPPLAES